MNLIDIISSFSGKVILVIGDVMIDRFVYGKVRGVSHEISIPIIDVIKETETIGGAGNVANNIVALGGKAIIVSVIGEDITGALLIKLLQQRKIIHNYLIHDYQRPTTEKTRIISTNQQVLRIDKETKKTLKPYIESKILKNIEILIKKVNAVIISDYGKGVVTSLILKKTIFLARKNKIPITVDPKIENFKRYKNVTTITPNENEAIQGMKAKNIKTNDDIVILGKRILKILKANSIVITRGKKGITLIQSNDKVVNIPTRAKEVYDVTGAGDTIISTMTLALAANADLLNAVEIANFAASVIVGKFGTVTITPTELIKVIESFYKK
ncbi:MAG: D-glycero-beta-D-manno-heptose-7-phosphate kinase [Endomicrobium sp.]|jgi:D-beta-D-heptose 7-phosphate kinase/D-beta-D-heptose 1-phosphate adenosyltransferase|nr:D-glycero-beta-D-manno-heptose-7-phosphate kinase [Endomicrobium sp.]